MQIEFNSNTILSIITLTGGFIGYVYLAGVKLARIEVKVDTMWLYQLRRGLSEVQIKNLGEFNSPLHIGPDAEKYIRPLVPDLQAYYKKIDGERLSVIDLAVKLEQQFGNRIASEVCIKAGIHDAACLIMAISVLRPVTTHSLSDRESAKAPSECGLHQ